jgi:hypothetical protein
VKDANIDGLQRQRKNQEFAQNAKARTGINQEKKLSSKIKISYADF